MANPDILALIDAGLERHSKARGVCRECYDGEGRGEWPCDAAKALRGMRVLAAFAKKQHAIHSETCKRECPDKQRAVQTLALAAKEME